ncbi:hypothetical protein KI387_023644, partial [Taxus chinensis]
ARIISDDCSSTSYVAALNALSSIVTPRRRADETGNNFPIMYEYLKILDLEESLSQLKFIHIAGTKGKGSTCTFVESILRAYGFRTGLYTSPHLMNICERYRLDGLEVSEEKFLNLFWWCWNRLKENSVEDIHFFQFLTLLAFKIFTEEKVDVAILEVGLGGKFDATNVVKSPIVCGISSLGYDHMEILGNTLTQITREKAGIMKPGVPAFTIPQPEEAMTVLQDVASQLMVPLHVVSPLDPARLGGLKLGLAGDHQYINAGLAVALCYSWLRKTRHSEDFDLQQSEVHKGYLPDSFIKGLTMANIPGRAQVIPDSYVGHHEQCNMEETGNADCSELIFYLDGAHTPESMEVCAKWFSSAIKIDSQSLVQTTGVLKETQNGFTNIISDFDLQQKSVGNSKITSKQVLLFNCFSERDPQLLLSQLVNTCALHGVHFDRALFVPSHSPFTQFGSSTSTGTDSPKVDLQWQLSLQRTWQNIICGCGGSESQPAMNFEDYDKRHKEALLLLKLSVSDDMIPEVRNATVASTLWTSLKDKYQTLEKSRVLYLKNMLFFVKLEEGGSLSKHLLRMKDLRDQLSSINKKVDNDDMVALVLNNLPSSDWYVSFTTNICFESVVRADGESLAMEGIGDICIVLNNAHKLLVRNVRYVPSLQKNLLSIRQLTENPNIYVDFCGKKCVVSDVKQRRIIALCIGEGGQYRFVDPAAINMNARLEDNSTIKDVQEVAMPWEEAIPHKSVDLDTVNLHAPIVEGVSTIPNVREDGFPHSKEQFVVDGDSIIPNALTVHGEMACPTTHSEVLARRRVKHEQFAHYVVKDLSQQRGIDEQIDEELVLTPTTVETETTAEMEMVISPTIAELVLTPTAQMVTFLLLRKLDKHYTVLQGHDRGDFDCKTIESLYKLQQATQAYNRVFNPLL